MGFFSNIRRRRGRSGALRRVQAPVPRLDVPARPPEEDDDTLVRISQSVEVLKRLSDLRDQVEATDVEVLGETEAESRPDTETAEGVRDEPSVEPPRAFAPLAPAPKKSSSAPGWRPIGTPHSPPATPVTSRRVSDLVKEPARRAPVVEKPTAWPTIERPVGEQTDIRAKIGQVFSPSAPVSRKDLFAGRTQQMEDLVNTVYERGQHAVIYGERGVGKTSLAATMGLVLHQSGTPVIRINCDGADDFSTIWHKLFGEIALLPVVAADATVLARLSEMQNKKRITPNDVRHSLHAVSALGEVVIFIDEFDTVADQSVHGLFADTLKTLSDQLVSSTVVIIGVADNLDELIAQHGSVRRALAQIHMPRMSQTELAEIVGRGLRHLGMACEGQALARITQLSQGFPYYTKLLAQSATRSALDAGRPGISVVDVDQAVDRVVARVHETIRGLYNQAISGDQGSTHQRALQVAALAARDDRGYFGAADALRFYKTVEGTAIDLETVVADLERLTKPDRGPALEKRSTERGIRYRFSDPLLQPFVLMEGFAAGEIEAGSLDQLSLAVGREAGKNRA